MMGLLNFTGACLAAATITFAGPKKNVLFLISDDLSAGVLGCYGNPQCRTPNLDKLARRSLRFERAYCQFPVCGPARAALFSGLYPHRNGVIGNGSADKMEGRLGGQPTMPEHFKRNGWRSIRVSKIYHMRVPGDITAGVDGPDHLQSWSEKYNCMAPEWASQGMHEHLSNEKLRKEPDKHYRLGFGTAFYTVRVPGEGAAQADRLAADKAIEVLGRVGEKPFFLAVGMVRPHVPLVAPELFFDAHPAEKTRLPETIDGDWDDIPPMGISGYTSTKRGLTDPDRKRKVIAAYHAATSFMDAQVGRVLAALEKNGHADDTIVVFTSDHGYHLGEHDFWQKMSLHEESARVPLLIATPGATAVTTAALAEHVDLFPTLCKLAGAPLPDRVQGRSLAPLFEDPTASVRKSAYCMRNKSHLLRTDRWAYMRHPGGEAELYDMGKDPRQFTNLAGNADHQATVRELDAMLEQRLKEMGR